MAKAAFNKTKTLFTSNLDLVLHLEYSFIWCFMWNFGTSDRTSEIPGKFRNVVVDPDGQDQLDGSREK